MNKMRTSLPVESATFTLNDADILAMIAHVKAITFDYYIARKNRILLSVLMWGPMCFAIYEIIRLYGVSSEFDSQATRILVAIFFYFSVTTVRKYLKDRTEIRAYCDEGWFKYEQTITTSDEYIQIINECGKFLFYWDSFLSFIEDDKRTLIGAGMGPCIVIPKDVGISVDRIKWIRMLLVERSKEL